MFTDLTTGHLLSEGWHSFSSDLNKFASLIQTKMQYTTRHFLLHNKNTRAPVYYSIGGGGLEAWNEDLRSVWWADKSMKRGNGAREE